MFHGSVMVVRSGVRASLVELDKTSLQSSISNDAGNNMVSSCLFPKKLMSFPPAGMRSLRKLLKEQLE